MKIQDAANILDLTGNVTKEIIKKAYRKASSKYHPDKGGSVQMMQVVNEAYETLKDFEGKIDEPNSEGYGDELNAAINAVIDLDGLIIEVCGAWVWVTGNTKHHKEALKAVGFKWAKKKSAWHYRPSDWKSAGRGNWSLDKIRERHGSETVSGFQGSKKQRIGVAA